MKTTKTSPQPKQYPGSVFTAGGSVAVEMNTDWHLPSGKSLEEFALEGGYLAPLLIKTANLKEWRPVKQERKRS